MEPVRFDITCAASEVGIVGGRRSTVRGISTDAERARSSFPHSSRRRRSHETSGTALGDHRSSSWPSPAAALPVLGHAHKVVSGKECTITGTSGPRLPPRDGREGRHLRARRRGHDLRLERGRHHPRRTGQGHDPGRRRPRRAARRRRQRRPLLLRRHARPRDRRPRLRPRAAARPPARPRPLDRVVRLGRRRRRQT